MACLSLPFFRHTHGLLVSAMTFSFASVGGQWREEVVPSQERDFHLPFFIVLGSLASAGRVGSHELSRRHTSGAVIVPVSLQ